MQKILTGVLLSRLFLLLLLLPGIAAHASRRYVPMGDAVQQANLIALADTAPAGGDRHDTQVTLREIWKGNAKQGDQLIYPLRLSTADVYLPREAKGMALLFTRDEKSGTPVLLELYRQPQEIAALRVLIDIYKLPGERERLLALRQKVLSSPPSDSATILRKQLWVDLGKMRRPQNFSILTGLFPDGDEEQQVAVVKLLGSIGDRRGVPTLLQALKSPRQRVAAHAAHELMFRFPGAPGVTAAFRQALKTPHLELPAKGYLKRYDANLRRQMETPRTPYQIVNQALENGDEATARPHFMPMLQDPKQVETIVQLLPDWTARSIAEYPQHATQIREALLPVLQKYATGGNYLHAINAAKILAALHHETAVPVLLQIADKHDQWLYDDSTRIAVWALFDFDAASREAALQKLRTRPDWNVLHTVFAATEAADNAGALLEVLSTLGNASQRNVTAISWLLFRLGEMREKRAVLALVEMLAFGEYHVVNAAKDALMRIGGNAVEAAMQPLLRAGESRARPAMEVLFALQKERFLPQLRRLIDNPDLDIRSTAVNFLGRVGTPQDIKLLAPLADFWKGDLPNHYWAMSAITEIRERHRYDVNGRIP